MDCDDVGHFRADARLAFVDEAKEGFLALDEGRGDFLGALDQRLVDLAGAGFERCVELGRAGVERVGAGLELADEALAALRKGALDAVQALLELGAERTGGAAQQRHHAGGAVVEQVGQRPGEVVGRVRQLGDAGIEQAGERLAGGGQPVGDGIDARIHRVEQMHAAFVDAVDQRVAGIGDRHRQVGRRVENGVADDVGSLADLVAQRLVRAGDRGADALGMGDDGLALAAETIDQRTDTRRVLGIGTLDLVDFGMNQGFQLDGARKRALDAFAHGRDFAADGLADHHDAVERQVFRLGEVEGHFRHGLGGNAHFLRAAHHRSEGEDQDDRQDGADREHQQFGARKHLFGGAGLQEVGEHAVCNECRRAEPEQRKAGGNPVDCLRRTLVQAVEQRAEVFLAVVVGRREAGRLHRLRTLHGPVDGPVDGALYRAVHRPLGRTEILRRLAGRGVLHASFAHQLVGCLRNLRLQVVHCGRNLWILARFRKVEVESVFKLPGNVALDGSGVFRHAAVTLYLARAAAMNWHKNRRTRGFLWTRRIVVTHTGKGNMQSGRCVKV